MKKNTVEPIRWVGSTSWNEEYVFDTIEEAGQFAQMAAKSKVERPNDITIKIYEPKDDEQEV